MTKKQGIQLFEEKKIRTVWDDVAERWYFSIVDVVSVLTESKDPALYWRVLKKRLKDEGNETVTNCNAFKLIAADGKMRKTDVADQEQLFRLIQSIPSPKAEPFKQWMAQVASNRIDQQNCLLNRLLPITGGWGTGRNGSTSGSRVSKSERILPTNGSEAEYKDSNTQP